MPPRLPNGGDNQQVLCFCKKYCSRPGGRHISSRTARRHRAEAEREAQARRSRSRSSSPPRTMRNELDAPRPGKRARTEEDGVSADADGPPEHSNSRVRQVSSHRLHKGLTFCDRMAVLLVPELQYTRPRPTQLLSTRSTTRLTVPTLLQVRVPCYLIQNTFRVLPRRLLCRTSDILHQTMRLIPAVSQTVGKTLRHSRLLTQLVLCPC